MDKNVKTLLRKLNNISLMIINNLNDTNIDGINSVVSDFERKIRIVICPPARKEENKQEPPIWTKFSNMTEEEIRQEFMNMEKYPDINSIKVAVKGYLDLRKVSKVKKRETLIKHIIETYNRGRFISGIGR